MNSVNLIGRLVRDPELKYTPNGTAKCTITLALDRQISKEKKAELQSKGQSTADFPRVIAWGKTAELCANYLSKGKQCAITGSLQTSTFKTNTGETRYSTDVIANHVEFLGGGDSKSKESNGDDFNFGSYDQNDFEAIEDSDDVPW